MATSEQIMLKHRSFIFQQIIFFCIGFLLLGTVGKVSAQFLISSDSTFYISFKQSMEYLASEVPLQRDGEIDWTQLDTLGLEWSILADESTPASASTGFILCRFQLPDQEWADAAIYIEALPGKFDIYYSQQRFFQYSPDDAYRLDKFSLVQWQIIPLPAYDFGEYLYFKFFLTNLDEFRLSNMLIGSHLSFYREIFIKRELDQIILGVLFFFTGLFSIFISAIRKHTGKAMASFSFAILTLCGGGMLISGVTIRLLFFNYPPFWYYFNGFSQLFFPVGIFLFYEKTFGAGYLSIFRRFWQLFLIMAIVILGLELFNVISFTDYFQYFVILFITATIISMLKVIYSAFHGNVEARIFSVGFFTFGFFGVRDMLMGLGVLPGEKLLWHWGLFVFVICLIYILERQFSRAQNQLKQYSEELEAQSEELSVSNIKLEEYSKNLEVKVTERTQDLEIKNKELKETMRELQETQQQLIIREKLASLGNLVAGVAHEINNPIGAIHSSSDVVDRSLQKISTIIDDCQTREDLDNNPQFKKSFVTINRNNRIILEGSKRVAHIVKSLKSFARLDEATYQLADIHDGLENTLELLYHEYKNKAEVVKEFGDIPEIYCYPHELNQVFMNILSNAVDAIKEEGLIKVKTYQEQELVIVEISDNGSGIPADKIDKIFDPGFTTKGVGVGTGLGLSISHNIIKKHRGRILIESEVGKGTVFKIILPEKKDEKTRI
jgi:signal transduction histidine kinase